MRRALRRPMRTTALARRTGVHRAEIEGCGQKLMRATYFLQSKGEP